MLYGTMSGLTNTLAAALDFSFDPSIIEETNKYYIQRYIFHTPNVLMVVLVRIMVNF
jgi:hypothetical protein